MCYLEWLFVASSDEPVELLIFKNGDHIETLSAHLFYHGHVKAQFPRSGYVAFSTTVTGVNDMYEVIVSKTGQKLSCDFINLGGNLQQQMTALDV